jgi:hypothetical protein
MKVYPPRPGYEHVGPTTSADYEQPPFQPGQHVLHRGAWFTVVAPGETLEVVPLMGGERRRIRQDEVRGSWRRRLIRCTFLGE